MRDGGRDSRDGEFHVGIQRTLAERSAVITSHYQWHRLGTRHTLKAAEAGIGRQRLLLITLWEDLPSSVHTCGRTELSGFTSVHWWWLQLLLLPEARRRNPSGLFLSGPTSNFHLSGEVGDNSPARPSRSSRPLHLPYLCSPCLRKRERKHFARPGGGSKTRGGSRSVRPACASGPIHHREGR